MINFSALQGLTIPEGAVTQIEKDGVLLWSAYKPGLYDANGTMVADWDTLVNTYGFKISNNYRDGNYKTAAGSGYYVFTTYAELKSGTVLKIPDTVTSIGSHALRGCNRGITDFAGLTRIEIPDSVTSIGNCAFADCTNLTSINIPSGVTVIDNGTFWNCEKLPSITVPEGVTSIGSTAFCNNYALTSITLPHSISTINSQAFLGCSALIDIYVPWWEGNVSGAPWGATSATIHYHYDYYG